MPVSEYLWSRFRDSVDPWATLVSSISAAVPFPVASRPNKIPSPFVAAVGVVAVVDKLNML